MKEQILQIYKSDWSEALAELSYTILSITNPDYIDAYEEKRGTEQYTKLLQSLEKIDSESNWKRIMENLASICVANYIRERVSGKSFTAGGPLTLIGHASHIFIEWGFVANIAKSLDNGKTKDLYEQYLTLDKSFNAAMESGDTATGMKLIDVWRKSQNSVDYAYEDLLVEMGVERPDYD
jgi:hypothetical protein